MSSTELDRARELLSLRRCAVVGVSRNPRDFSRTLLAALAGRGLDVVPVNPAATEVDGRPCFARVQDVRPTPEWALLLTPPAATEAAVRACAEAGIRRVWLHRGAGAGAATPAALAACRELGLEVVTDLCPFMALPGAGFPHRLHGFLRRVTLRRAKAAAHA